MPTIRRVRDHIEDFFEGVEIEHPDQAVAVGGSATSLRRLGGGGREWGGGSVGKKNVWGGGGRQPPPPYSKCSSKPKPSRSGSLADWPSVRTSCSTSSAWMKLADELAASSLSAGCERATA